MICDNCIMNQGTHCDGLTYQAKMEAENTNSCKFKKELPYNPNEIKMPDKFRRRSSSTI